MNIDWKAPQNTEHNPYWRNVDILDAAALNKTIADFEPDYVVHLAARTDLDGKTLDDYAANTVGVKNMVNALQQVNTVKRVIFASTQLVCARRNPKDDCDYETINLYGESKKIGEEFLRGCNNLPFEYTIVRPTSIWGPWFGVPYSNFFRMVLARRYFNMGKKVATKTFGFVGNLIYQVETLLFASNWDNISKRVFYLGDQPATPINEWAEEIAGECGIRVITIPYFIFRMAAYAGDFLKLFGVHFPMTSYRLTNMTTSFENDLSAIYSVAPAPPFTRLQGTKITLDWIKKHPL